MLQCTTTALLAALLLSAAPNPARDAANLLPSAQKFRDLTAAQEATVRKAAEATANHARATAAAAATAEQARNNALAERKQAEQYAAAANSHAQQTVELGDVELTKHRDDAVKANALAQDAFKMTKEAYAKTEVAAQAVRSQANTCQAHLDAADKAAAAASEALRVANEALETARVFAEDARLAFDVQGNAVLAELARQKTAAELGKIQTAQESAAGLIASTQSEQAAAAELRRLATADLAETQRLVQVVQTVAKATKDQALQISSNYLEASAWAGHLRNPGYLLAQSHSNAANSASSQAADAARRSSILAAVANKEAAKAQSVATTAHAQSANSVDAIVRTSAAVREAMDAAGRADAAVRQADIEAAKFSSQSPQAKVAHRAAAEARSNRAAAQEAARKCHLAYIDALNGSKGIAAAATAAGDADRHAKASLASATDAQQHAQAAIAARDLAVQAHRRAEKAAAQLLESLKAGDNVPAATANLTQTASNAKSAAEQQAQAAKDRAADAEAHAAVAVNSARLAAAASDRVSLVALAIAQARRAELDAVSQAATAESNAARAGLTRTLQTELSDAWDDAEVRAVQDALRGGVEKANQSKGDVDVQRAADNANGAELLALRAEAKSAARIRAFEARARTKRADNVTAPPSPFYFASTAHFPLRGYGPNGEIVDHDGLLIYEDMKFAFDHNGNYEVNFRTSQPNVPVTIKLQFQVQPHDGGPWYTVTLAPIKICANSETSSCKDHGKSKGKCTGADAECCGEVHPCVCKGRSEILRRCYAEMGHSATIRRSGTARFGYGVANF